jgi:hypothetical protein
MSEDRQGQLDHVTRQMTRICDGLRQMELPLPRRVGTLQHHWE